MVKKHMKRYSTLLIARERKSKLQGDITLLQSEWPPSKKSINNKMFERVWREGIPLPLLVGM